MKHHCIIFALGGLLLEVSAPLQASGTAVYTNDVTWFQKRTQALYDAVAPGNKVIWNQTMANDCIFTDEDGKVYDKAQFLKSLKPLPAGFTGHISVKKLSVLNVGEAVVVHYWLDERESALSQNLQTTYVETDTYRWLGTTWKMVAAQVTVVPRNLQPVRSDTSEWPSLLGTYSLGAGDRHGYYVYLRNGNLYGGLTERSATRLIPLSPLVFFQQGSIHIMVFVKDTHGAVNEVLELHKYNEVVLRRITKGHAK